MHLMDTKTLQEIAEYNVRLCWNKAAKRYLRINQIASKYPTISLNNRFKTTAGMAYYEQHHVALSTELFSEHTEEFVKDTIPHEVAHLVAAIVYEDFGHGSGWKKVMLDCYGLRPERLHNMVNSKHEARKAKV